MKERGGRGEDDELSAQVGKLRAGFRGASGPELRHDRHAVGGGGEGLAHVAVVGHRLGENQHVERGGISTGGAVEKSGVLGELFGVF